jgi:hypothetical protein
MPTVADALKLIERDPVVGFVTIAVIACHPPAKTLLIRTRGRTITLPAWSGTEWSWYGQVALAVAKALDVTNPVVQADKDRAQARLIALHPAVQALGAVQVPEKLAFTYYDACVRLVIESVADASVASRGRLAAEAIGSGIVGAPRVIAEQLAKAVKDFGDLYFRIWPREAMKQLRGFFGAVAEGAGLGFLSPTVLLIGAVVLYYVTRKGR